MYSSRSNTSPYASQDEEDYPLFSLQAISFEDDCRICDYLFTISKRNDVWFWR